MLNPALALLQPYPFQKLRALLTTTHSEKKHINLSIGEPKHATPSLIEQALLDHLSGLAVYPTTQGTDALRAALATWLEKRFVLPEGILSRQTQVLPVNGSREALFAFAQTVIDTSGDKKPVVIMPNPFYQIYEGAALLAGAEPYYLSQVPEQGFQYDFDAIPEEIWARTQLIYVCSPGNPTGYVIRETEWKKLFALADQYGFVIASDECYSELYFDEAQPPIGALQMCYQLGRTDFNQVVTFGSLSKRSNVPGMRSGYVAGDAAILAKFLLYRTYHGCAMNPIVQAASVAAWQDELHVIENRKLYCEKYQAVLPILNQKFNAQRPDGGFYIWLDTNGIEDTAFALRLFQEENVTVLPGQFLARTDRNGINPGKGFVRIALVAPLAECIEAAERIIHLQD